MSQQQKATVVHPAQLKKAPPQPGTSPMAEKLDVTRLAGGRKRKKRLGWGLSFLLMVLLPTVATAAYYMFVAADQYRVETRFAVRSTSSTISSGILSSLGLGVGGTSVGDTYIVLEYIHSREIIRRIDREINLRERFRKPAHDFYAALPEDASFEDLVQYWRSMIKVGLDRVSLIITVETFAFTPEDARDIARAILKESERMVNEISARAREDALAYAESEVRKAEARLREVRQKFLRFRSQTQQIDPARQAEVQVALIGKLEAQLAELKAKLSEARGYLTENAPTIQYLNNRIRALQRQINEEKKKLGNRRGGSSPTVANGANTQSLSATLSEYEALVVDREFAEKFYLSTLNGLEQARLLANRQQRYLATFVQPYLSDEALYPKKLRNTVFVFIVLTLLWGLAALMWQSVRDRM